MTNIAMYTAVAASLRISAGEFSFCLFVLAHEAEEENASPKSIAKRRFDPFRHFGTTRSLSNTDTRRYMSLRGVPKAVCSDIYPPIQNCLMSVSCIYSLIPSS